MNTSYSLTNLNVYSIFAPFEQLLYYTVFKVLEYGGPLYMKVGQYLSTKENFLPMNLIVRLKRFQDNNITTLPNFDNFRSMGYSIHKCMGSGTIGAVYKISKRKQAYAVKIRHSNIYENLCANKKSLKRFIGSLKYMPQSPSFSMLQFFLTESLVDEMFAQHDFIVEANTQTKILNQLKPLSSFITIPSVVDASENHTIQSFETGLSIDELFDTYKDRRMIIQAFALIESTYFNMIRYFGFVHNDMHEGNFKFKVESNNLRLILYDFGYCKYLESDEQILANKILGKSNLPDFGAFVEHIVETNSSNPHVEKFLSDAQKNLNYPKYQFMLNLQMKDLKNYTKYSQLYNDTGINLSTMMTEMVQSIARYGLEINQNMLNIILNMMYMVDYEAKFIKNADDSIEKQCYVNVYNAMFKQRLCKQRLCKQRLCK